jgi:hypothetical protein
MVEQPNQVSAGGQRLVFGYYHPGTSNIDTATWLNDTGYVIFCHCTMFYGNIGLPLSSNPAAPNDPGPQLRRNQDNDAPFGS